LTCFIRGVRLEKTNKGLKNMFQDKVSIQVSDKPIQDKIFNSLDNLEGAVELEQPTRVGSLLYWELKLNQKFSYADAVNEFSGSPLELNPISGSIAIKRFCDAVIQRHSGRFGGLELKSIVTRDADAGCWFISFYTGKAGELSTDFRECFKLLVSEEFRVAIINFKDGFLMNLQDLGMAMDQAFLLTDREFQQAMADYANRQGYRLSQSGGYYFMPMPETSKLYNLKKIFERFAGKVRITPLIFCNDQDAEDIVEAIGSYYGGLIEDSERLIFELNMGLYKFTQYWDEFKVACLASDNETLKGNKISRTVYGRNLIAKLGRLKIESSPEEYAVIAAKIMNSIKPKERVSASAIRNLADNLLAAEEKLKALADTALLNKCIDKINNAVIEVKVLARKTAEMISDEVAAML
jgi:hypothetical protein